MIREPYKAGDGVGYLGADHRISKRLLALIELIKRKDQLYVTDAPKKMWRELAAEFRGIRAHACAGECERKA